MIGGGDEGSYIACGKLLSERFGFVFEDEVAKFGTKYLPVSSFATPAFRRLEQPGPTLQVVSGWNKGFAFISIPFWWLDADAGWKYVSPLAGALSLITLFLIGARLHNTLVGLIAALLLGSNFLQLWFSRYPMTEVLSQSLLLLMFLSLLEHHRRASAKWALSFSGLSSLALFVHFGNAPLWLVMAGIMSLTVMPVKTLNLPSEESCSRPRRMTAFSFDSTRVRKFLSVGLLTLGLPSTFATAYWLSDPGIQRYTRLGKKMADSTGQLDTLVATFLTRVENLALFIPLAVWFLIPVGIFVITRDRSMRRWQWFLLIGLAVTSFAIIACAGVGTPRVLYVARRNVPFVLPAICLICARALDWVASALSRFSGGRIAVGAAIAYLVGFQLYAFAPVSKVDQGKGTPQLASRVRAELVASGSLSSALVIVPHGAVSFVSGMRWVYGIPIVTYSEALTPMVIESMLNDGLRLYSVDLTESVRHPGALFRALETFPNIQQKFITSRDLYWTHINPIDPTLFPAITDRVFARGGLYRITKKG